MNPVSCFAFTVSPVAPKTTKDHTQTFHREPSSCVFEHMTNSLWTLSGTFQPDRPFTANDSPHVRPRAFRPLPSQFRPQPLTGPPTSRSGTSSLRRASPTSTRLHCLSQPTRNRLPGALPTPSARTIPSSATPGILQSNSLPKKIPYTSHSGGLPGRRQQAHLARGIEANI